MLHLKQDHGAGDEAEGPMDLATCTYYALTDATMDLIFQGHELEQYLKENLERHLGGSLDHKSEDDIVQGVTDVVDQDRPPGHQPSQFQVLKDNFQSLKNHVGEMWMRNTEGVPRQGVGFPRHFRISPVRFGKGVL